VELKCGKWSNSLPYYIATTNLHVLMIQITAAKAKSCFSKFKLIKNYLQVQEIRNKKLSSGSGKITVFDTHCNTKCFI